MEDWLIAIAGCIGWNVLLWGLAHDEADKEDKSFNWVKYKRSNLDDFVVTLLVGVPLVVWKNEWLWEVLVNRVPLYFVGTWVSIPYDCVGLLFAGPVIQLCYMGVKKIRVITKKT